MRTVPLCTIALLVAAISAALPAADTVAAQLLTMTGGARAKLVWIRACELTTEEQHDRGKIDPDLMMYGESEGHQLIVLDTKEGKERVFQAGPGCFANPLITRDGERVIWSDVTHKTSWVSDWAGKNKQKLSEGETFFVLSTQWDAATKTEWVYAYDGGTVWATFLPVPEEKREALGTKNVYRFPLAKGPAAKELVWSKTRIGVYWTVSSDGKKAASVFPWPKTGIADLPDLKWADLNPGGDWGCWSGIAPDDSYRFFFFQGNHKKLSMFDPGKTTSREIDVTGMPGNDGVRDAGAPRFANHPRFLCIGTPLAFDYKANKLGDVYLGRFDEGYTKVEQWVQVSNHPHKDVMLSTWLESGVTSGGAKKEK